MRSSAIATWVIACGLLVSCSDFHSDGGTVQRISELEDSLKVYRDSLRDAQGVWSFNSLSAVVKLQSHEFRLGDSCRAELFIGASNTSDAARLGYRYGEARLELEGIPEARITKTGTRWIVAFKPDRLGEDSLIGNITVDGTFGGPSELSFASWYNVVK